MAKCEHRGRVWLDGDDRWECLNCGHGEKHECGHEKRSELAGVAERVADFQWCADCRRPVPRG